MAVDRNPEVMGMVEKALRENPDVSNEDLQERAAEIDEHAGELSARSFNARYPLQVKRTLAAERGEGEEEEAVASEELQSAVRKTLLDYAKDVAAAEDRGEVIDLVEDVDEYVDRVMEKRKVR